MPFHQELPYRIPFLLSSGKQPSRLSSPKMEDHTWNLIEECWFRDPSKRPTMERIVDSHMPIPDSPLTALISEVCTFESSMNFYY